MPGSPAIYCLAFPWGSAAIPTIDELMRSVEHALQDTGRYSDIKLQPGGVECRTANSNSFILCAGGNGNDTTCVIASAGDDAFQVKDDIAAIIQSIRFL